MLPIQERCWRKSDEELATIGIGTTVCHTQYTGAGVFERRMDFIFEFLAEDGTATPASARWVAGLDHEIWDYTMEDYIVVVASLRQGCEILTGLRLL